MLKQHGTIRLKNPQRRRKLLRSAIAQTILQTLTFGAAIVTYHYAALPQLTNEARKEGQAIGWQNAVKNTCPIAFDRIGG
mgnify:CR=1 FL=1